MVITSPTPTPWAIKPRKCCSPLNSCKRSARVLHRQAATAARIHSRRAWVWKSRRSRPILPREACRPRPFRRIWRFRGTVLTVQATTGQQLYTRDGQFTLNANNQLVNDSGGLLLGYGVDNNFNIQATQLKALSIPLGSTTVAKATQNVTMQGAYRQPAPWRRLRRSNNRRSSGDAAFTAPTNTTTATWPTLRT